MNVSRLATLAVFFMMILSAFVTIPNYHVGAEEDEDTPGAYFVFIMTTDRSDAITSATPFSLHFPAPPMSDKSPYELDLICEGDEDGFIDGIYGTWVHSEGGNAGDFNNITSWSVKNTNGIQLEKFMYNPMSDIIDFDHPMVIFEDDEDSGGGHIPATVFDQEEFHCEGDGHDHDHGDDGPDIEAYYATMQMESLDSWLVDFYGTMSIEESDEAREGIAHMCAEMMGTDEGEITEECFSHWLDMMMSGDDHGEHGGDDCPFDADNPDSPCNAEVCHYDNDSPECNEYTDNYCETSDDPVCIVWVDCGTSESTMKGCYTAFYDHCTSDNPSEEICEDMMSQDENGTWLMCFETSDDGETWYDDCQPNWFIGLVAYERGDISASQFMDSYLSSYNNDHDNHMNNYEPVLFELSHITLSHAAEWTITPDYLEFEQPDFVCGNHEDHEDGNGTIPFYWVNDGYDDCGDGSDEQWYDNNTSDDHSDNCQKSSYNDSEECEGEEVNWFDCHDDSKIWIWQVNNGEWNCQDGEDEYRYNSWSGDLYLYEGHLSSMDELNDGNVIAKENYYCDWADEDMVEVECDSIIFGDLVVEEYTLATVSHCNENWESYYDEDNDEWRYELNETSPYDCDYWGEFSHEIMSDHGESHTEYIDGSVDQDSFGMFNFPDCDDFIIESCDEQQFVLFAYYGITVPAGSVVDDYLISGAWECYSHDEDDEPEHCYTASTALYVYDGYYDFNESDEEWYDGDLIASNHGFDGNYDTEGYDCMAPLDTPCRYSRLHLELSEGYYTIVTATTYTHSTGIEYGTYWQNGTSWDSSGILEGSYWTNEDSGGRDISAVSVDDNGNIVTNFTQAFETDGDGNDIWIRYEASNTSGGWDYIDSLGLDNGGTHENFTCWRDYWCNEWDGESTLRITLYAYGNYTVAYWNSSTPNLLEFVDPEWHQGDDRGHFPYAEWECSYCDDDDYYDEEDYYNSMWMENITMYFDGEITAEVAAENIVIVTTMMDDAGLFDMVEDDYDDMEDWNEYDYCEWEGDNFGGDTRWYCADEYEEGGDFDNWWYYCEVYNDDDDSERWVCTDNFGGDPNFEFSTGNTHYKDGTSPHDGHDHDEHHDEDDNPALLDGIVGVNDPEDAEPMPMAENMIGALSDNEGLPMMMGTNFKIHFEGVDASLEIHEAYIPIGGDGSGTVWHVEMTLLEGYELISCDGCEDLEVDGINSKFSATEPVTINFGEVKEVDTTECDAIVTVGEGGYSFEPAEITISEGDTVCWIWEDTADVHNVAEIATVFDAEMNLEEAKIGFYSGESVNTVDFRHTFTENDKTHYYVCEPHATMGMVGKVTVGNGTEDDPFEAIADESGLPSISFAVGILVLVGAAGLRRRIH